MVIVWTYEIQCGILKLLDVWPVVAFGISVTWDTNHSHALGTYHIRLPAAVLKYSAVNKVTLVCLTTLEAISHAWQLSGSVNHPLSIPPSPTSFPGSGSCDSIVHLHEFNVYIWEHMTCVFLNPTLIP